jgi:hypothetical protein
MSNDNQANRRLSKTTIDIILLLILAAFFGLILIQCRELTRTAALVPKLTASLALILCLIQIVAEVKKRNKEKGAEPEKLKPANLRWYYLLGLILVYIVCLTQLGFVPAAILFLLVTPYILGQKKIRLNIAVALIATAVLYFAFVKIFHVTLPAGTLFDYLS